MGTMAEAVIRYSNRYFTPELAQAAIVLAIICSAVVVGLFVYEGRRAQRSPFNVWAVAWMFYAVHLASSLAVPALLKGQYLAALPAICLGFAAVFLLSGSLLILGRPLERTHLAAAVAAVALVWSATSWLGYTTWFATLAIALLGVAGAHAGLLHNRRTRHTHRMSILAGGLALWGLAQIAMPLLSATLFSLILGYLMTVGATLMIAVGVIVEHEVAVSEEKYRSVLDGTTDGVFMVDLWSLRILDANQAAQRLCKRDLPELVGGSFLDICPDLRKDGSSVLDNRKMFATVFKPFNEFHLMRSDGSMTLCRGDTGVVGWHGRAVAQVRIQTVESGEKVGQLIRRAEKMSSLGQMIAGVAHELNNPLAVVVAHSQILAKQRRDDPALHAQTQRILHETERAAKIVRDLLSFARPCEPQMTVVDINRLVANVLEIREADLLNHNIKLDLHLSAHLPKTKADPIQIEQVLNNLVTNSIHALSSVNGAREHVIEVHTQLKGSFLGVTVADNGPGIAAEVLPKIFDPFFTTKAPGKGIGLGLSISHSIMQEHHGRIWAESEAGRGATFLLELPVVPCDDPAKKPTEFDKLAELGRAADQPQRLLIVDDEPGIREVLEMVLSGDGYAVETAGNGTEAMKRIESVRYDLIISDMCMPEMDGKQFYETVRRTDPRLANRIVFVTGDTVSNRSRSFLEETGNRWLSKPFDIKDVERTVAEVLGMQMAVVRTVTGNRLD